MAIRKVARMGHPVLREVARQLSREEILSPQTKALVQDMIETMDEYGGIGIAAPQVHESLAIALIDYQPSHGHEDEDEDEGDEDESSLPELSEVSASTPLTVIINPKVTVLDEKKQGFWEGCLSVPEIRGLVYRPRKVQIDYLDLQGEPQMIIAEDFLATVFQHELDHLFGIIFVDRIEYQLGRSPISFIAEYQKYWIPEADDEIGELGD